MNETCTISIIEPEGLAEQCLSRWLNEAPGIRCVSAYADIPGALRGLPEERPHLVLVDLRLPDAVDGIRELKALLPGTRVVALSVFEDADQLFAALAAGAAGCLPKNLEQAELIAALREARRGALPPSSDVARKVLLFFRGARRSGPAMELGATEQVVLEFLARSYRCGEIADALGIRVPTVRAHLDGIYAKLQARCRWGVGPAVGAPAWSRGFAARRGAARAGVWGEENSLRTAPGILFIREPGGSKTVTIVS